MSRELVVVLVSVALGGAVGLGLGACGPQGTGKDTMDAYVCGEACDLQGSRRCIGATLEQCVAQSEQCIEWQPVQRCDDDGRICVEATGMAGCEHPETCFDQVRNQDETYVDCGGTMCPGCGLGATCVEDRDCALGLCSGGLCVMCRAESYRCFGNWLRQCDVSESFWSDVEHCNALGGQICSASSGACEAVQPIGNGPSNPTGEYYQFAYFTPDNSEFLGGADVDTARFYFDANSWEDRIYVNRDGAHVDVYRVELLDSDGDGEMEPNQHPDNPDNPGEIEERRLTLIQTHDIPINGINGNELYVIGDTIFFTRGVAAPGDIFEWDMLGGMEGTTVDVAAGLWSQVLGYDDVHDRWYTATPYERWVFSLDPVENEWVLEFEHPNLAGDHSDGLEVVTDPKTGIPYVYVSDMTSDYVAQYVKDATGNWVQENLFIYHQESASAVEGMGFGAFNHFWCTSQAIGSGVHELYEIGGGDIEEYVVD